MTKLKIACKFYQNDGLQSENRCDLHCSDPPSLLVLYDIHVLATIASQETGQVFMCLPQLHLKKLDSIEWRVND